MDSTSATDALLTFLTLVTPCIWPLTLLMLVVLFYRDIRPIIKRLTKVQVAGVGLEFAQAAVDAAKDTIEQGLSRFEGNPAGFVQYMREQVDKMDRTSVVAGSAESPSTARRTILWVDDHPDSVTYESNLLRNLGMRITTARSTREAQSLIERGHFDLVISDILRDEDGQENHAAGYDLLDWITSQPAGPPVVFYLSNRRFVDARRARRASGWADNPSELVTEVLGALANR